MTNLIINRMRKITSLVAALLLSVATFAQAPQGFSYQAVVRDAQNALVANQTVDVTLTITAEVGGVAAQSYTETHSVTTNANGLFTLVVGQGESSQKLSDIKWNVPGAVYNLRTETAYGTATTQLMSVPFALYAEQAGELDYQKLAKTLTSDDVQAVLGYVKAEQLADYVKKSDIPAGANLDNYVLNDSLVLLIANVEATYAKKSDIPAPTDLSSYAKTADVEATYAKKSDIQAAADMSDYVKADTLSQYALNTSLKSYISKEAFADYILSGGNIESVDLDVYAKTADVDATYAKKSDIPAATDLSGYAKTADVASDYVTKETFDAYVLSGGQSDSVDLTVFAKTTDVEATYAKKSDIPAAADLSGYAKNDTLSQYALNTSLASYVTKEAFDAYVLSGGQADSVDLTAFAKTADVEKTYAKKSDIPAPADLSGYAKAADVVSKETFANYILGAGNPDAADLSVYAKTADVASTYVTKEAFDNYVSNGGQADSVDLSAYAKTADVEATYAKKSELPEMDNYVTVKDLNDTLGYYLTSESNGQALLGWFYTKSDVDALISDKVTDSDLQSVTDQFLTKETFDAYVLSGGQADSVDLTVYAKTADVAATYAKKSDIPAAVNLGNYVTKDSLNILVEHQSLADYAKTSDLAGYAVAADVNSEFAFQNHYNDSVYLRKANADYTYAKRSDVAYTIGYVNDSIDFYYAKKADVASTYVTKETFDNYVLSGGQADSVDLTVYAKTADVAATYAKKSDIPAAVNLSNYVVKDSLNILVEHQSLAAYATKANLNDTLADYAKTADLSAKANTADLATVATSGSYNDLTNTPTGLSAFENDTEYVTASELDAQGYLTEHQSLAAYAKIDTLGNFATQAKLNDTLAVYTKAADVEAAYATKTEVAGKQDVIDDIETIRIGANLGATALQEHQSLADYATTAKLNDTLAEYATTAKLNDTLDAYATLSQLQQQIAALQTTMAQLTKNANQIGDMPLANVTVKVVYANDYSGSTDIATVSFLGKTLKSGETTFKVPAYSPAFLSVALSTFNVSNKYYTYTVKVNGEYFDNLAYEYEVANENVYNSGNVSTFNYNTSFCKSSLSNIKIGSKEKDDTYNNRAFYQDPKYIYVDVVDAIQDIDLNDGRPKHQSGYTDMEYFENRLLIGVTNAQYNDSYGDQYLVQLYNGGDASPRIGVKPRWYRWSDKTWNPTDDYNEWEAAMGLVHMSNYNQSATFIKPIYAKVPNFIYKNTFTTKTVYKVGTESGTGLGRNGLNANMNNQVVGPFNQTNNTIVIEVSSYTVVN